MLYTDYYKKFSKLVAAMTFVKRHWIPILIAAVAVLATAVTLTSTKGLVYDKTAPPQNITYGEEFVYSAGAFMSGKVAYEFRADGSDEWTSERPLRAGKYYVRALSYRAFGIASYGNEHGFTIMPKPVDVKVADRTIFGDAPQVSAELCYDDTISCDGFAYGNPALTETTVRAILGSVKITDADGNDVTGSYTLNAPEYGITFEKRAIRITVEKTEIAYDGNPHRFGGFDVTQGSLAEGDVLTATFDSTVTEVGSIDVEPEFVVTSKDGINVTGNYEIDVRAGKLEITPQVLTVKTPSASKVYDGKELFCTEGYEIIGGKLADGHELVLSANNYSRITEAGTGKNTLAFTVSDGGDDVTKNYAIALEAGTLEVVKKSALVTTGDKSWVYDGAAHGFAARADVSVDGLLKELGHDFSIVEYATVTDVAKIANTVKIKITDKNGKDVTENYAVDNTTAAGALEITRRTVKIKTNDRTWVYDGETHSDDGFAQTADSLYGFVAGHVCQAYGATQMTDVIYDGGTVGTADNVFAVTVASNGKDVTSNYKIEYVYGKLKIVPRPVTVKADSESRVYNDMPLSVDRVTDVTPSGAGGGLLKSKGHYFSAVCSGEQTDVGTSYNAVVSVDILCDGVSVKSNYAVSVSDERGELTVAKRPITVVTASEQWMYDGKEHSKNVITAIKPYGGNDPALVSDHEISARGNAGDYAVITFVRFDGDEVAGIANTVTPVIRSGDGTDKTGNYEFFYEYGTLTVTKRPVTLRPVDKDKVYDDTPLTGSDIEVLSKIGFADGDLPSAVCNGSLTDVGTTDNEIVNIVVARDKDDVTANYEFTFEKGKLTVTVREITVPTEGRTFVYNGYEQSNEVYSISSDYADGALANGHEPRVTECAVIRFVEQNPVENKIVIVIEKDGEDKTANYKITYDYAHLYMDRLIVRVTCGSRGAYGDGDWVYDGTPHTWTEFELQSCNADVDIPDFDIFEFDPNKPCSSITDVLYNDDGTVGSAANVFGVSVVEIVNGERSDRSNNYELEYIGGKLTLNPRPVTVTSATAEFVYDGQYHSAETLSDGSITSEYSPAIIDGHCVTVTDHTEVRDVVRDADGNVVGVENEIFVAITDGDKDVAFNYEITYEYGTLTVKPLELTISTSSKTWVYDGNPHKAEEYTLSPENIPDACAVDSTRTVAEVTDVIRNSDGSIGTIQNEFYVTITRNGADASDNYEIKYEYGALKIEPIVIYYSTGSAEKYFDGTPLVCATASIDNDPFVSDHACEIAATGTITFAGSVKNDATITVKSGTEDVTHNYEPTPSAAPYGIGTLTVKAVKIKITTESDSKVYDGTPLKKEKYSYAVTEGEIPSGHTFNVKFGDGRTDAGSSDNAVTVKVMCGADDMTRGYEFEYEFGKLTVTLRKITVATTTDVWEYDGKPHRGDVLSVGGDGLARDQKYTVMSYTTLTDAVSGVANKLVVRITDAANNNVTKNYKIDFVHGTLTVTPRKIAITTSSASKMYDGEFLSAPAFEITAGTLADGQTASVLIDTETKIRYFGTAENRLQILIEHEKRAVTTNYDITWKYGELEITKRPVTIETASHKWQYDGAQHYDNHGDAGFGSPNQIAECDEIIGENYATITDVGEKPNTFTVKIYSDGKQDAEHDATASYSFNADEIVYGVLNVYEVSGGGEGDGDGDGNGGGGNGGSSGGGQIGGGEIGMPEGGDGDGSAVILSFKTSYAGELYMRQRSFGDYRLNNKVVWGQASNYAYTVPHDTNRYALSYLTSIALENSGVVARDVEIKLENIASYVLPYYVGFGGEVQTSDVLYAGASKQYTASFYPYEFGGVLPSVPQSYAAAERKYYEFVKENYSNIPQSTLEYMRKVIAMQKFDESKRNGTVADRLSLIESVARYIRGAATYSMQYNRALDSESDPAVEFLRSYKEGICSHYATSGTMLLRALGFPARYTTGVTARSDGGGEWQEVRAANAHAWVEVYIESVGWIEVEVTGGGDDGSGGGNGSGGGSGRGKKKKSFTVKPLDVFVEQGNVARPENAVVEETGALQSWLKKGYSYTVETEGEQSALGTGASRITEFRIYDPRGNDATDEFDIKFATGKLCVTKPQVKLYIYGRQSVYNGNGVYFDEYDYDYDTDDLPAGYTIELAIDGIGIEYGAMTIEGLRNILESKGSWYTVRNAAGADVTASFSRDRFVLPYIDIDVKKLKTDMSEIYVLELTARTLNFLSGSATKVYDGSPLVNHTAFLTFGTLLDGHRAEYKFTEERIDVGEISNIFTVVIYDGNGKDVTSMYNLYYKYGTLEVVYE